MIIEKQYARRLLEGYTSPYDDPFTYCSISQFSSEELNALYTRVLKGDVSRDLLGATPAEQLAGIIEFAGDAYDPVHWLVVLDRTQPIGIVFPQVYSDNRELGSIFNIGLIPEVRGKGFGKILHAKGLEKLVQIGATKYVGSTDVLATAMIRIFQRNGCELTKIVRIDTDTGRPVE